MSARRQTSAQAPHPSLKAQIWVGLLLCPTTVRNPHADSTANPLRQLWNPAFPSAELVTTAANFFDPRGPWDGHEGPRPRIVVAPGCIALETRDAAKAERTYERELRRHQAEVAYMAAALTADGEFPNDPQPWREVTHWSRKSRARMVRRLCELDYTPLFRDPSRVLAMVTLTYPGDWLPVAPNGKATKKHLRALRKRYARMWGEEMACFWKMEFQARGAPHFHLLMAPPHGRARDDSHDGGRRQVGAGLPFREWLSAVWADIVAHPDPDQRRLHEQRGTGIGYAEGLRATDPKRVAVYFTKHGMASGKAYQHEIPETWQQPGQGPGRFWGHPGLHRAVGVQEISDDDYTWLSRLLRRYAHAQRVTRQVTVTRTKGGTPRPQQSDVQGLAGAYLIESRRTRKRKVRRRAHRFKGHRSGWLSVNDVPTLAACLATALTNRQIQ